MSGYFSSRHGSSIRVCLWSSQKTRSRRAPGLIFLRTSLFPSLRPSSVGAERVSNSSSGAIPSPSRTVPVPTDPGRTGTEWSNLSPKSQKDTCDQNLNLKKGRKPTSFD